MEAQVSSCLSVYLKILWFLVSTNKTAIVSTFEFQMFPFEDVAFPEMNMQEMIYMPLHAQGIVTAPVLFAMEEFPELRESVERGFDDPSDIATVSVETPFFLSSNIMKIFGCEMINARSALFYISGPGIPCEKPGNREDKVACY